MDSLSCSIISSLYSDSSKYYALPAVNMEMNHFFIFISIFQVSFLFQNVALVGSFKFFFHSHYGELDTASYYLTETTTL